MKLHTISPILEGCTLATLLGGFMVCAALGLMYANAVAIVAAVPLGALYELARRRWGV